MFSHIAALMLVTGTPIPATRPNNEVVYRVAPTDNIGMCPAQCPECKGLGKITEKDCTRCSGKKYVWVTRDEGIMINYTTRRDSILVGIEELKLMREWKIEQEKKGNDARFIIRMKNIEDGLKAHREALKFAEEDVARVKKELGK